MGVVHDQRWWWDSCSEKERAGAERAIKRFQKNESMTNCPIRVGARFRMSDGSIAVVTKATRDDHYDLDYYDGRRKVGVPAWHISGDIIRLQDAGFRERLPDRKKRR